MTRNHEGREPFEARVFGWKIPHTVLAALIAGGTFGDWRLHSNGIDELKARLDSIEKAQAQEEKQVVRIEQRLDDLLGPPRAQPSPAALTASESGRG